MWNHSTARYCIYCGSAPCRCDPDEIARGGGGDVTQEELEKLRKDALYAWIRSATN